MNIFLRIFSYTDVYGVSQNLTFFKRDKYKSIFGNLLTIVFLAYFLSKLLTFINNFINKQSFTQVNNIFVKDNELNINNFEIAHCIANDIIGGDDSKNRKFSTLFFPYQDKNLLEFNDCDSNTENFLHFKLNNNNFAMLQNQLQKICSCGKIKKDNNFTLYSDLYKFNTSSISYNIYPKEDFYKLTNLNVNILTVFKNFYFDYSNKESAINFYPFLISQMTKPLKTEFTSLYLNKMSYSEIIDFDIFYKKEKYQEEYLIKDTYESYSFDVKSYSEPLLSYQLNAGNTIFNYNITILSMDNVLASFSGVFQILSLIFGLIGNFFNEIFFNYAKKNYFQFKNIEKEDKDHIKRFMRNIYQNSTKNLNHEYEYKLKDQENLAKQFEENAVIKQIELRNHSDERKSNNSRIDDLENLDDYILKFQINSKQKEEKKNPKKMNNYLDINRSHLTQGSNKNILKMKYNEKEGKISDDEEKKICLSIFENYVNSFEFLFDTFSQLELIKRLLFDENTYMCFNDLSKIYLSHKSFENQKDLIKNLKIIKESQSKLSQSNNFIYNNLFKFIEKLKSE